LPKLQVPSLARHSVMLFMRQLQIDSTSIPRRMTVERPSKGRRTAVER